MKRLVLTAAALLISASPVLAASQLEESLDVQPGRYTTQELAMIKGVAQDTGSEGRMRFQGQTAGVQGAAQDPRAERVISDIETSGPDARSQSEIADLKGVTFTDTGDMRKARNKSILGSRQALPGE